MHEKDSNSQRDNLYISGLENLKGNNIKIIISDGTVIQVVNDIIIKENIYEGKKISLTECEQIKKLSELLEAEKHALNLLSYRQHSKKSLELKLIKRGFSKPSIESVISKLEDLHYLDDAEFARAWVESRITFHPEGKSALLAGLLKQGINRATAETVINDLVPEQREIDCATILYRKLESLHKPAKKIANSLRARGFQYSIIRQVMGMEGEDY